MAVVAINVEKKDICQRNVLQLVVAVVAGAPAASNVEKRATCRRNVRQVVVVAAAGAPVAINVVKTAIFHVTVQLAEEVFI